ncbi:MAG: class I SAM-dependent RNA methyltransferase [Thermomicrobia bacterium]|nr:class I SAM-dependent RNA methyltransferase [Thermomicrobia bacterium]
MVQKAVAVGATIILRADSMANGGAAVGRYGALVVFIQGAAPGEHVSARIVELRKTFARAVVVDVLEPSPDRVAPPCPYFGACGGCQWQFLDYGAQVRLKGEILRDQFRRGFRLSDADLATIIAPPVTMRDPWRYRNVVTVEPTADDHPAFHHLHSAALVAIDHCPISQPAISTELARLSVTGMTDKTTIRTSDAESAVSFSVHERRTVYQTVLGRRFRVSGGAFFQVNTRPEARPGQSSLSMADRLAQCVLDGLALTGDQTVLDLYAGVGVFAILAAPQARRVIAVEEVAAAGTDARFNAMAAGLSNLHVHVHKAERFMATFAERVDAVVLDPPRSGCDSGVLDGLLRLRPARIVYVSCDVATLVRDLRVLHDAYRIERVQLVDMFPQTYHIEAVTVLTRRETKR